MTRLSHGNHLTIPVQLTEYIHSSGQLLVDRQSHHAHMSRWFKISPQSASNQIGEKKPGLNQHTHRNSKPHSRNTCTCTAPPDPHARDQTCRDPMSNKQDARANKTLALTRRSRLRPRTPHSSDSVTSAPQTLHALVLWCSQLPVECSRVRVRVLQRRADANVSAAFELSPLP